MVYMYTGSQAGLPKTFSLVSSARTAQSWQVRALLVFGSHVHDFIASLLQGRIVCSLISLAASSYDPASSHNLRIRSLFSIFHVVFMYTAIVRHLTIMECYSEDASVQMLGK